MSTWQNGGGAPRAREVRTEGFDELTPQDLAAAINDFLDTLGEGLLLAIDYEIMLEVKKFTTDTVITPGSPGDPGDPGADPPIPPTPGTCDSYEITQTQDDPVAHHCAIVTYMK